MPLPPAPAKRGHRLSAADIEASQRKPTTRSAPAPAARAAAPAPEAAAPAPTARKAPNRQLPALTQPPPSTAASSPQDATPPAAAAAKKTAAKKAVAKKATGKKTAVAKTAAVKTAPAKTAPTKTVSKKAAERKTVADQTPEGTAAAAKTPASAKVAPPSKKSSRSSSRSRRKKADADRIFVLDTNVLLHDPTALFRFEEHDIYLPLVVLEELDAHKRGTTEVARNGRQVSRMLDALVSASDTDMHEGLPLDASGQVQATGRLFFQTVELDVSMPPALPQSKADNQILGVVAALEKHHVKRPVVLVSKDINMRVKARALGLQAEDYESDKTLDDGDLLYSGMLALPEDFWEQQGERLQSWQDGPHTFYRVSGPMAASLSINQFVFHEMEDELGFHARVVETDGQTAVLRTLKDHTQSKHSVWGVLARNREQNFALDLLMDPDIDFVTIAGTAGTGKTLLALAAGLTQVLDQRRYGEIIMTRATVSVGEDIGFLPGTEEEKMLPWMGALDDNLEFLAQGDASGAGEWGRAATNDLMRSRVKVKAMNFMRGRTFLNKWIIVDEAQNLTPKQMKTLITRAGPGTKIICMGNLAQIDTPYLTEGSSGLTYAVDRFKGWPHGGHITLARGERSRLADFASEVL